MSVRRSSPPSSPGYNALLSRGVSKRRLIGNALSNIFSDERWSEIVYRALVVRRLSTQYGSVRLSDEGVFVSPSDFTEPPIPDIPEPFKDTDKEKEQEPYELPAPEIVPTNAPVYPRLNDRAHLFDAFQVGCPSGFTVGHLVGLGEIPDQQLEGQAYLRGECFLVSPAGFGDGLLSGVCSLVAPNGIASAKLFGRGFVESKMMFEEFATLLGTGSMYTFSGEASGNLADSGFAGKTGGMDSAKLRGSGGAWAERRGIGFGEAKLEGYGKAKSSPYGWDRAKLKTEYWLYASPTPKAKDTAKIETSYTFVRSPNVYARAKLETTCVVESLELNGEVRIEATDIIRVEDRLDKVSLWPQSTTNLIVNGDFESFTTLPWTPAGVGVTIVGRGVDGGNCAQVCYSAGSGTFGSFYQDIAVEPGARYRLTYYVKAGSGTTFSFYVIPYPAPSEAWQWYPGRYIDFGFVSIPEGWKYYSSYIWYNNTEMWRAASGNPNLLITTARVGFGVATYDGDDCMYFDKLSLVKIVDP